MVFGLWLRLNLSATIVVEMATTQCITLSISLGDNTWMCSGVYASPSYPNRCTLWDHLRSMRLTIDVPWMMLGDVNEILLPSEQKVACFMPLKLTGLFKL